MELKYSNTIGTRVWRLRFDAGLSQEEVAFRADLDRSYLSDLERGKRYPSLYTVERLSEALELDMTELFDYQPDNMESPVLCNPTIQSRLIPMIESISNSRLEHINEIVKRLIVLNKK